MLNNKTWILILLMLAFSTAAGCSREQQQIKTGEEITMFVATDIHYLAKSLSDNGVAYQNFVSEGDGRSLNYVDEIMSAFTKDVINQKPDILIISGDLTNNGEKESHRQLEKKLKEIEASGTRIFVIPGNHDIDNPWARKFEKEKQIITETITAKDFSKIYSDYGYDEAISRDEASLSYLAAPSKDLWLLMLDTNEYELNRKYGKPTTSGELKAETLEWIKECSKLAKKENARIVTVMHHNLYRHNAVLHYGYTLDNSEEAYEVFKDHGLNLVLSGHLHIQDIKSRQEEENTIYDIVTSSMIMYPEQYGILTYIPNQGYDYTTTKVKVESWAKAKGIEDENLLNFSEYAKDRFAKASYRKAKDALSDIDIYTSEEIDLMAETVSLLNLNYFSGTAGLIKEEVIKSPGYKLWEAAVDPEFFRDYVLSMVPNRTTDHNQLHIPLQ